jgi:hypothetical protein
MVATPEVFLPYAVTDNDQTLYEHVGQHTSLVIGDRIGTRPTFMTRRQPAGPCRPILCRKRFLGRRSI